MWNLTTRIQSASRGSQQRSAFYAAGIREDKAATGSCLRGPVPASSPGKSPGGSGLQRRGTERDVRSLTRRAGSGPQRPLRTAGWVGSQWTASPLLPRVLMELRTVRVSTSAPRDHTRTSQQTVPTSTSGPKEPEALF